MNAYIPMIAMVVLAILFVLIAIGLSVNIGPRRYNRTKYDSFECGIQPTPQPVGGGRFDAKYYITAMLFIIFDIEIIFLYPWAVSFDRMSALGSFMVVEMALFLGSVAIAYIYVVRRGGLEWD